MAFLRRLSSSSTSSICFLSVTSRGFSSTSGDETLTTKTSVPFISNRVDLPSCSVDTTSSELLSFQTMSTMHLMEITVDSLYKAKRICVFYHIYNDQEAVEVSMEAAITKSNAIFTAYCDHYVYLDRGGDLVSIFAELMGRHNGCSRGKEGSQQVADGGRRDRVERRHGEMFFPFW
ncbi:pyruvate dehydrogenase E1 component subunit alpha-1, mitochondrial-like [Typha angustifolia]|uniref:pyruvate dehydrogenase E1 component subunit alpha-1, mitochondrial-like n=1 Tax=Typha angustifolia TaxID=59011 RepID=UPI003C2DD7EC